MSQERPLSRPTDIPEKDWQDILKGTAFAKSVAEVDGNLDAGMEDHYLDYAGEVEQALKRRGYIVVSLDSHLSAEWVDTIEGVPVNGSGSRVSE